MKIYNLVSQGVLIRSTLDEKEAVEEMERSNKFWREYYGECIECGERPADNEIFLDTVEIADDEVFILRLIGVAVNLFLKLRGIEPVDFGRGEALALLDNANITSSC